MPKRKTLPKNSYTGIPTDENKLVVSKSTPLQSLSQTDLTLPELKILDSYLARIDSHDMSKRTVTFRRGELEKYLGVSRIMKADLDKRLRHLFQLVEVKDETKKRGFKIVSLFEEAYADEDDDGVWQISLTCTPSAREYIFNVDNLGYIRYRLKNVIELTSRYSYVLYLYLEDNRFRKSWEISLSELKKLLNCTAETYQSYKYFNDLVLKKCYQEINQKTTRQFEYEAVKRGRKVTAIRFTVMTKDYDQISFDEYPDELPEDDSESQYSFYAEACENAFSDAEMALIVDALTEVIPFDTAPNLDLRRYDFLRVKYHELIIREQDRKQKPITNRCKYLVKMITKAE